MANRALLIHAPFRNGFLPPVSTVRRYFHAWRDAGLFEDIRCLVPEFDGALFIAGMEGYAMGQVLHGSASTTAAVRRAIQDSQESLRVLAKRHGINPKTVAKWRSRSSTVDVRPGPKDAHSTVLSIEEEAMIVAFRKHTLLPLDDCLYALQATIPHLTRSSLHRCFQRHDISRLPEVEGDKPKRSKFRSYPIGYSISTLPRCAPSRASFTCSWRSTGPASSPSSNCTRTQERQPRATSCSG